MAIKNGKVSGGYLAKNIFELRISDSVCKKKKVLISKIILIRQLFGKGKQFFQALAAAEQINIEQKLFTGVYIEFAINVLIMLAYGVDADISQRWDFGNLMTTNIILQNIPFRGG